MMDEEKKLSKKQLAVIDDLFSGELDEQALLRKHKVRRSIYNKWQCSQAFTDEFEQRIAALNRQGRLIIARYASVAAAKLVQLTESEGQETARKACLDIINLPQPTGDRANPAEGPQQDSEQQANQLSPETAARLLAALAEGKGQ